MGTRVDLQEFVKSYTGPKLRLLFTGVGSFATGILGIPGASNVVESIFVPYSKESVVSLILEKHPTPHDFLEAGYSSVSLEMVNGLHACNSRKAEGLLPVTVTGAITSTRYRRGENHAFIAMGLGSVDIYHLQLDKLKEEEHTEDQVYIKRYVQDRMVSESAIALATGTQSDLVDELQKNGFLRKV